MAPVIETVDLARRFRRTQALDGVHLHVPAGSIFALIGPNGAGKTTAIKLLMNLLRPSRGKATVLGVDSRRLGPRELERIAYVSENQRLPEWMTTDQLLDYVKPLYRTWDDALCRKLRGDLGLTEAMPLRSLSRGTRMKAALLASLAYHPELIVLDEPFTGLDPLVRDELIRALLELPGVRPCTVFISSHDIEEVERLADWVAFLDRGRLAFAEPVTSLLGRFRLVEVIASNGLSISPRSAPGWVLQGVAGRTLKFVDTSHTGPDAEMRIASVFPGAEIRTLPLTLREVFVVLARSREAAVRGTGGRS